MVHDVQAIRDDLTFMRALAQEGRRAPLMIGRSLLTAGTVFGAASLAAYALASGLVPAPGWWMAGVWAIAFVVFYVILGLQRRAGCRIGATSTGNRAVGTVWRSIGLALMSLFAAAGVLAYETRSPVVFALFPSIVLAIYGVGWTVATVMSDVRWLRFVAAACFTGAVLVAMVATRAEVFLVYAAAMGLLAALPGWRLLRAEPTGIV